MRYSVGDENVNPHFTATLTLLLCGGLLTSPAIGAEGAADAVVARRMSAFYEVYTGRKLTPDETGKLTREFVAGHARRGRSRDAIRDVARDFGFTMILLREEPEHAAALTARHRVIELNYFRREMQGTFELELLTEPDPVRIVDSRSRRLMTQRDVEALVNLHHFAKSQAAPAHRKLSREGLERVVAQLKRSISMNGASLPQFFTDAAGYWAGVRQQWPYFNSQQRALTRAYAENTWRVTMPVEMYASLWGLDRAAASTRWTNDVSARIRGRPDGPGDRASLRAAMDSAFEP
jgi:hypothetical protein